MTAHAAKAGAIVKIGAIKNKVLFDLFGVIIYLNINFNASAIGCRSP